MKASMIKHEFMELKADNRWISALLFFIFGLLAASLALLAGHFLKSETYNQAIFDQRFQPIELAINVQDQKNKFALTDIYNLSLMNEFPIVAAKEQSFVFHYSNETIVYSLPTLYFNEKARSFFKIETHTGDDFDDQKINGFWLGANVQKLINLHLNSENFYVSANASFFNYQGSLKLNSSVQDFNEAIIFPLRSLLVQPHAYQDPSIERFYIPKRNFFSFRQTLKQILPAHIADNLEFKFPQIEASYTNKQLWKHKIVPLNAVINFLGFFLMIIVTYNSWLSFKRFSNRSLWYIMFGYSSEQVVHRLMFYRSLLELILPFSLGFALASMVFLPLTYVYNLNFNLSIQHATMVLFYLAMSTLCNCLLYKTQFQKHYNWKVFL